MKRVLFVDDEPEILRSLSRLFYDADYEILTADSGLSALNLLENTKVDIVISDMRMPVMDGFQLLNRVRELYPSVIRVILSAYTDEQTYFKSLSKNVAKLYIFKPWTTDGIVSILDKLFESRSLLSSKKLLSLINNIDLPTIQSSYQRILRLIEENAQTSVLVDEIERDPAIAAKVLHFANSAFYGVKTGSVKQAVSYLGFENIRSVIISTSMMEVIDKMHAKPELIKNIWKHAFLTNQILNIIYNEGLKRKISEVASSAGLLHNIGMIFFHTCFSNGYLAIRGEEAGSQANILDLEMAEFDVTHQQTGGYLLEWWELPYPIIEAALYHHTPLDNRVINREIVAAVHIAQKYAWELLCVAQYTPFFEEAFEYIKCDRNELEMHIEKRRQERMDRQ